VVLPGLESCCEAAGAVVARDVPVMWLATAGSTEINDTRLLKDDSETIAPSLGTDGLG